MASDSTGVMCAAFSKPRTPPHTLEPRTLTAFFSRFSLCGETLLRRDPLKERACKAHEFGADSSALEVATTTAEANTPLYVSRRCITDPRRSIRQLRIRLETWLSRLAWEAIRSRRYLEGEALLEDTHYLIHLRKQRAVPCPACTLRTVLRLKEDHNGRTQKA